MRSVSLNSLEIAQLLERHHSGCPTFLTWANSGIESMEGALVRIAFRPATVSLLLFFLSSFVLQAPSPLRSIRREDGSRPCQTGTFVSRALCRLLDIGARMEYRRRDAQQPNLKRAYDYSRASISFEANIARSLWSSSLRVGRRSSRETSDTMGMQLAHPLRRGGPASRTLLMVGA